MKLEALKLDKTASGKLSLFLTEDVTYETFPSKAKKFLKLVGGLKLISIKSFDIRTWVVLIKYRPYFLTFDDLPWGMSLDPMRGSSNSVIQKLYQKLVPSYLSSINFQVINEALGTTLPENYTQFIKNYPSPILTQAFWATQIELLISTETILKLNLFIRQHLDLEPNYFLIGESGCGDYYFIDLDETDSPVYFWNHDIEDFDDDEKSHSLVEHAGKLLAQYKRLA